jgi:hypothetical protein
MLLPAPRLLPHLVPKRLYLLHDQLLHPLRRLLLLEPEIDIVLADGLVRRVVPDGQVRVVERLITRDSSGGVEGEETSEKVEGEGVGLRVEVGEGDPRFDREGADVLLGLGETKSELCVSLARPGGPREKHTTHSWRADAPKGVLAWGAEEVKDLVELVDVVAALEDGLAPEELSENAADGPHVDGGGVVGEGEHDLRGAVPSRGNV